MASPLSSQASAPAAPDAGDVVDISPRRSKRVVMYPVIGILLIIGLVWGVKRWSYGRTHESTDNAQVDADLVPVLAKVGGYVQTVSVAENQHVEEGTVVVTLDDAELRVRLAQAEADLAAAQSVAGGRGQAAAMVATASGQRASLEAQVAAARANQQRALADLGRVRELADKQIISRQQLDAAQAAATSATANLEAAERQASAAGGTVSNAKAGTRLADARLAAAAAVRDNAALQLSYAKVIAPMSGTVSRKQVDPGQLVQPGQPLFTIVGDSGVWVTANFKETQLSSIRVGQPVELDVDAYGGCRAEGAVESLSAATGARFALIPPDNATGNFTKVVQRVPVRIDVTQGCGKDHPLRPGMSVDVHVNTGSPGAPARATAAR